MLNLNVVLVLVWVFLVSSHSVKMFRLSSDSKLAPVVQKSVNCPVDAQLSWDYRGQGRTCSMFPSRDHCPWGVPVAWGSGGLGLQQRQGGELSLQDIGL